MTVREIDLPMPGGTCDALLALPDKPGPHPGVLFIMDAIGLRPQLAAMVDRIASWGYAVLAPNVYWRVGRQPLVDPALFTVDNAIRRGAAITDLLRSLTPSLWAADGPAYLDHLGRVAQVKGNRTRVVGYCMGGRLGLALAAQRPERIRVLAAFHPGGLVTDEPGSPHRLLPLVRARLHFAFADNDPGMPPEAIERFVATAKQAGCKLTAEVYPGAAHGYTMADLPAYSAEADARHWTQLERVFGG